MTEDDNATTAAELPLEEEENGGGGDIEEGKIVISENTDDGQRSSLLGAAISHGTSTPTSSTTTTLPLGGIEDVDEEDAAAPVPSIQQTTDMGIEKDDTNTRNNTVAASEDASMTPQPPAQDAMEQIEDGDDAAAPRPFNSSDFEDDDDIEPKPEIELCEVESTDEDDGPPLPLSQQRDSLSDAKTMAALSRKSSSNSQNKASDAASSIGGDEWIGGDPIVQQIDQHPSPGDEENVQKRVVGPEENQHSASAVDEQDARQVVSTAEATNILEAYLVEEERGGSDDGGHGNGNDTVYEATLLEPELPWWKQRRTKVFMAIICVLMTALAASLGVAFSRSSVDIAAPAVENAVPPAVAVESSSSNSGEWEQCTDSIQCENECCSSKYSDDGVLKCTPVGGFKPKEGCVGRGEWEQCTDSIQCENECCSSKYSDDGALKCTPVGGFKPKEGCVGSSTTTSKLGEWEQCTDSRECENECCSSMYSEGVLKCTPVGGFNISDGCVGSATRHLRGNNNEDEVLTVTDETTLTSKP